MPERTGTLRVLGVDEKGILLKYFLNQLPELIKMMMWTRLVSQIFNKFPDWQFRLCFQCSPQIDFIKDK